MQEQPKKILIVEDEGSIAEILEMLVKGWGYEVCGVVHTGEGAVENALHTNPDVILMDVNLEGKIDGIEAAEKIQKKLDVSVIFVTAHVIMSKQIKNVKESILINKPIVPSLLHNVIKRSLERKEKPKVSTESKRFLIVEDSRLAAKIQRRILEKLGHIVIATVSTGEEAVAKARHMQPDVVLSNIDLAGRMDGIEAAYEIHNGFGIPVILISGKEKVKKMPFLHISKQAFTAEDLEVAIEKTFAKR